MKKVIFMLAVTAAFMTTTILTSCQSPAQKAEDAQVKVQDAKQDLTDAQKEAAMAKQKAAQAEEWNAFKMETDAKIKDNETYIAELKVKMKAMGKKVDAAYAKSVAELEQKNKDLKTKLESYDSKGQSDWEAFKREFNHDMDGIGQSLKDLTVNNKK